MTEIRARGALLSLSIFAAFALLNLHVTRALADDTTTTVFVEVAATKVRPQPKYWAPGIADLIYGAPLTVISRENDWVKVRTAAGVEGFIGASAVTMRKVALAAGSDSIRIKADDSDVVLAGKGFNDQIESGYRATRKDLNFNDVDAVQKVSVSDGALARFVAAGKLRNP